VAESTSPYAVGVISHASYAELDACVAAACGQAVPPRWVRVLDMGGESGELDRSLAAHPGVERSVVENRGYAHAANLLIERAGAEPGCDYLLLLNSDVRLEPGFARAMLAACEGDPRAAIAGGRLLRSDGRTLDSTGIVLPRNRRPRDRGSEQVDVGQYSEPETIFGASGSALWLRLAAAQDLAIEGEVFDEDFFVYHEDTDIAWRAALFGWRVLYVPDARAEHERGWKSAGRFDIPVFVRRHSFKNHSLQMIKNDRTFEWLRDLPWIAGWELIRLAFALFRDPALLPAYLATIRLVPRALHKRRLIQARARGHVQFGSSHD